MISYYSVQKFTLYNDLYLVHGFGHLVFIQTFYRTDEYFIHGGQAFGKGDNFGLLGYLGQ